jgi:guanylate kinase
MQSPSSPKNSPKNQVATIARRGLMLVLSSPSGAGKTTLSRLLLNEDINIELSVSVTTRPRRLSEVDGRDYRFITQREYDALVRNDELLEWAEVFGHFYGTPKEPATCALNAGRDVLFDIDWQGTRQLADKYRQDVATIFVLPPSLQELERRLHRRAEDSDDTIRKRMAKATEELSHWTDYDYVIINHDLNRAFAEICAILAAERRKRERQRGLADFVRALQAGQ